MANSYFKFKQFTVHQDRCAMKVTTDGCLFGGWVAERTTRRYPRASGREADRMIKILDIGTGTGLLTLMLAQKIPFASIDAVEIDTGAFEQAKENVFQSPWPDRIQLIQADIKDLAMGKLFDIIISNPPFYENEIPSSDDKRNLAHHGAGLLIDELLPIVARSLEPNGCFFLLTPGKRETHTRKIIHRAGMHVTNYVQIRQSPAHSPFRCFLEMELTKNEAEEKKDEIIIWNERKEYTDDFRELLEDYYLHL